MESLQTGRLTLIPLTLTQLEAGLRSINELSFSVGVPIVGSLFEGVVQRAVTMKIEKMKSAPPAQHAWFTYWLILVNAEKTGAGMIGFKGSPNGNGEVEVGYGIDEVFQKRGYITEALCALTSWAFSHAECQAVTATAVRLDNFASQKVLLKSGFVETGEDKQGISYILRKEKKTG